MASSATVFVVDDDPGALRSLCWLIQQADLPVQGFRSGQDFLNACRSQDGGCLVLDIRMPGMDGLEVQRQLSKRGVRLPIIFITAHGDVPTCVRAHQAGALGFLEKPVDDQVLLDQIHAALARRAARDVPVSAVDFENRVSQLTRREKIVFNMLIAGKTLKEIAAVTNVTVQTAWRHRCNIFAKLAVENEVQLVRIATQVGYKAME